MSYEKQTWQTGDVISATKLNHIEQGLVDCYEADSNIFVVNFTMGEGYTATADKTLEEIAEALENDKIIKGFAKGPNGLIELISTTTHANGMASAMFTTPLDIAVYDTYASLSSMQILYTPQGIQVVHKECYVKKQTD